MYTDAACRDEDPELFFPERKRGFPSLDYQIQYATAAAVCAGCPVRARCLEENLDLPDGIWGGLDTIDRGRLLTGQGRVRAGGLPAFRNMSPFPNDNQVHAQRRRQENEMAGNAKRLRDSASKRRRQLARSA